VTDRNSQRIAYLASEYPAVSHTFIYREIEAVRRQGIDVCTASIRRAERLDVMTDAEREEARATRYIKQTPRWRVALDHLVLLLRSPRDYARMTTRAASLHRSWPVSALKAASYFAEAGVLARWMMERDARHVHVHFANPAATVALIACAWRGLSFSLSIHGPDLFYNVDTNCLPDKLKYAAFVRCISYFCQSQVMRLMPVDAWDKVHIVRCGIQPDVYRPRPDPQNAVPEFLCVGRLVAAKGQHVLLQAAHRLRERGRAFHLTFVGDGPDRTSLEAHASHLGLEDSVTFAGAVGQAAIQDFYDRADVFVLASFAEGLPVVLMEAMAKGIACVSTPIAAISELIEHDKNGLLVPPSDVEGLADALERLLDAPELRRTFGERGRERVAAEYDVQRNCEAMGALFRMHAGVNAPRKETVETAR
jgi:glycosyltransferase involved in cell wall biosynthesis